MPLLWKPQSCLCFHISSEQSLDISLLDSTNGSARAPPIVPHSGGAKSNVASTRKSQVEKSSPTYRATRVPFFPTPQPLSEISPWHKAGGRKSSTLPAPSRHAQGHSHEPSMEEATQSICGSHDSSSLTLGQYLGSLPSSDSLQTHQENLTSASIVSLPSCASFPRRNRP